MTDEELLTYFKENEIKIYKWRKAEYEIVKHIAVMPGWNSLVKDLCDELIFNNWNKQIEQWKEKFGALRFYCDSLNEDQLKIISKYEKLSSQICERCGKEGKLRQDMSWWRTLCNTHHEEIKQSLNKENENRHL